MVVVEDVGFVLLVVVVIVVTVVIVVMLVALVAVFQNSAFFDRCFCWSLFTAALHLHINNSMSRAVGCGHMVET